MSLHPTLKVVGLSSYSALSFQPPSPVMGGLAESCRIPVLPYKHASKWNSTMYKQHEPFNVAFDAQDTTAGCGVRHKDLAFYSAATVNTMIVRGGELVCFPPPARKIRFRIVWPGYETVDFSATIDVSNITVSELAGRVVSLYTEFFEVARQYECAAGGLPVTPELLHTLRILGIRNVYDNVYQAEITVG